MMSCDVKSHVLNLSMTDKTSYFLMETRQEATTLTAEHLDKEL
jgi:hypothetical protein